ncbi:MAG: translocation/assembly module TamB [Bacteroidia bacterium]|nr:translocation/assembly module TamB [Bacteroidia bacterium]
MVLITYIIFESPYIQTIITKRVASYLSDKLKTEVSIGGVDISLFNSVILEEVLVRDQLKDTLLYVNNIKVTIRDINFSERTIDLNRIVLDKPTVNLFLDSLRNMNYSFIIKAFSGEKDTTASLPWALTVRGVDIKDANFSYKKYDAVPQPTGMNYSDIDVSRLNVGIRNVRMMGDSLKLNLVNLDGREKCGINLKNMSAEVLIDTNGIVFTNALINTSSSRISAKKLAFLMKSVDDLSEFVTNVKINADINHSLVGVSDIAYFSSALWGLHEKVIFTGKIKGTVSDFKAKNVRIQYADNTYISGNFTVTGLPVVNETFMILELSELSTDANDIQKIPIPPFTKNFTVKLPVEVERLGRIYYKGQLTGYTNDFVAYGDLKTGMGNLNTDISIKQDTLTGYTNFNGHLISEKFDLGSVVNLKNTVGKISLDAKVDGRSKGKKVNAKIEGLVKDIEFKDYTYQNVKIEGELSESAFEGSLLVNDPNLALDFLGKIDYSEKIPMFNFTADVGRIRLGKLKLINYDSLATLSFLLSARFSGDNPDNLLGKIELFNLKYKSSVINESFGNVTLISEKNASGNNITLNSEIIDATLTGNVHFSSIMYSLDKVINSYIPSVRIYTPDPVDKKAKEPPYENIFDLNVEFNNTDSLLKEFAPGLLIEKKTRIVTKFSSVNKNLNISVQNGNISYSGITAEKPEVKFYTENGTLLFDCKTKNLGLAENLNMRNLDLQGFTKNNLGEIAFTWNNPDTVIYKGDVSLSFRLQNSEGKKWPSLMVESNPSMIVFSNMDWYINDAKVEISDSLISIKQLTINHESQYIFANGNISKKLTDTLTVLLNQIDLANSNLFLAKSGVDLNGIISGESHFSGLLGKSKIFASINVEDLKVNNEDLGNAFINSEWDDLSDNIKISGNTKRGNIKTIDFDGKYYTDGKIDFHVVLDKLRIGIAEPYIHDILSDLKGIASGDLTVTGNISKPVINGLMKLQKASFMVTYLQTRYNLTTDVTVTPTSFDFKNVDIFDADGNKAVLNGGIKHNNFSDLKFNLGFVTDKFMMLNTTEKDNELFYGKAYASGVVDISGSPENLSIDVTAKTEKDTKIFIPLSSGSEVSENNFIRYVSSEKDSVKINTEQKVDVSGIKMNFDIQATPDAEVQIIFDSKMGDVIKGRGNGNLRLEITPTGDFNMFGDYTIESGDYLFTLQNVINKKFNVEKGGTISWNGNPYMAILDITAIYRLKASLYDLMLDSTYKQRVPVECVLNMRNSLMKPDFLFSIKLPEGDSKPNSVISSLSNEDINKQIISLLVLSRFVTPESFRGGQQTAETRSGNAVGMNSSELLSNQLSQWLSQISKDFDIGVNYRPGDELTHDEVELALSTQIFNDRVTLNGNVGVGGNQATQSSNFVGDFEVDVKINKSGKLMVKGFNRSNTDIINDTSPYTQGLGLFYKEDFDSFGELLRRYWKSVFTRKKEEEISNQPKDK